MENYTPEVCPALQMLQIPYIGFYDTELYQFLQIQSYNSEIPSQSFPNNLLRALIRIEDEIKQTEKLQTQTIVYNAQSFYNDSTLFHDANMIYHPYVFNDAAEFSEHKTFAKIALFTHDDSLSEYAIQRSDENSLSINTMNILDQTTEVLIHPKDSCMACSPNNARFKFSAYIPTVVFFSVCMVEYKGTFPRVMLCKHIIINTPNCIFTTISLITDQEQKKQTANSFLEHIDGSLESLIEFIQSDTTNNYNISQWLDLQYFIIWKLANRPSFPNFGEYIWHQVNTEKDSNLVSQLLNQLKQNYSQELKESVRDYLIKL